MSTKWERPEAKQASRAIQAQGPTKAPPAEGTSASAETPSPSPYIDPYARWAVATEWRGMSGHGGWDSAKSEDQLIHIIARAPDEATLDDALRCTTLQIPAVYHDVIPNGRRRALHFTAAIRKRDFDWLTANSLNLRWELSQPRRDAETVARGSTVGRFGPSRALSDFRGRNPLRDEIESAKAKRGKRRSVDEVIAVIDFGCPFLNMRYADPKNANAGASRLVALWDQGSQMRHKAAAGWPWTGPADMGYGREIEPHVLNAMLKGLRDRRLAGRPVDELEVYKGIDYLIDYDDARRRIWYSTHGAHVLDVAGGVRNPVTGQSDDAGSSALIFVQLPSITAADSSGASLASHLLDGVRFVLARCEPTAKIVIVISYGCYAGRHDGLSLLEAALDELLEARTDDFAIVLSAGNSRQKACHARRTVMKDRSAYFRCVVSEGDTTDTFVEFWYEPPPDPWQLRVRVRGPDRVWSGWVLPDGETRMIETADDNAVVAMIRHDSDVPTGRPDGAVPRKAMVLLALAPTSQPLDVPCSPADAGTWEVEIELVTQMAPAPEAPGVSVDARIERDDPGQWPRAEHHFADQDPEDELDTLSDLATGKLTVVAGGFRLSDRRQTEYTSVGPQRQAPGSVPMVLAACEEDEINPNILATAVRSSDTFRMNGTSVAAPVLARQLFNLMKAGPPIKRADLPRRLKLLVASLPGLLREPDPS